MQITNVILSGGVGSRLWPLSRKSCPKQYAKFLGEHTLFQRTVIRNRPLTNRQLIVGNKDNYILSKEQIEEVGVNEFDILVETVPKNTAPAIAFAAFQANDEDILLVTPSDHIIQDDEAYEKAVNRAFELASENSIVTFGVKPDRPETGYGYIKFDKETAISFTEKPDPETAKKYLNDGDYLWNSGIFCFKAGVYLQELEKSRHDIFQASKVAINNVEKSFIPAQESEFIPEESIDYAVLENSDKIKVVSSEFVWSDLGSFESLYNYFKEHKDGENVYSNNLIISDKRVEVIGLDQVGVIETDDAILILPIEDSQNVKKLYEKLEVQNPDLIS